MANAVDLASLRGSECTPPLPPRPRIATRLGLSVHAESGRRLRVDGALRTASPVDCAGSDVLVRVLHGGRSILARRVAVTSACHFAATKPIGAGGRIEVRVSFAGSSILLPARSAARFVRTK